MKDPKERDTSDMWDEYCEMVDNEIATYAADALRTGSTKQQINAAIEIRYGVENYLD
jgi:hypothetical protein